MVSIKSKALAAAAVAVFGLTSISTNALAQTSVNVPATVAVIDAITLTNTGTNIDFGTMSAVQADSGGTDQASVILQTDGTFDTTNATVGNASISPVAASGTAGELTVSASAGVSITFTAPTTSFITMDDGVADSIVMEVGQIIAASSTTTPNVSANTTLNTLNFTSSAGDDVFGIGATIRTGPDQTNLDVGNSIAVPAGTFTTTAAGDIPISIAF